MKKRIGRPDWLKVWQDEHGHINRKLDSSHVEKIKHLYHELNYSQADIAKEFDVKQKAIHKFMKKYEIPVRSLKEAHAISNKVELGLRLYQQNNSWNKGLTKNDIRMEALIKKGRITQIKNGKSKGVNNPMYGKPPKCRNGYRKDLDHFVRSSWEANFARVLKFLHLDYQYEKHTFKLSNGDTYTPDFFVSSKNKFYEVKGYDRNEKYKFFIKDYPNIKISIVNQKLYDKIIKIFSNHIAIDDNITTYTKQEILEKFTEYEKTNGYISVRNFCKFLGISNKTVIRLFGSESGLRNK